MRLASPDSGDSRQTEAKQRERRRFRDGQHSGSKEVYATARQSGSVRLRAKTRMTLSRRTLSVSAGALCATVFFLASADRLFTVRTYGVNVRFAIFALANLFGVVPRELSAIAAPLSRFCLVTAMVAIGLTLPWRSLTAYGWRPVAMLLTLSRWTPFCV